MKSNHAIDADGAPESDAAEKPPSSRSRRNRVFAAPAGVKGLGVFAGIRFGPRARVLVFGGRRMRTDDIRDFTHTIQVAPGVFLGPSGETDDYVNHSCDPNSGLAAVGSGLGLFALRTIEVGEEITFDYSTGMVDEPAIEPCYCGASECRGSIRSFAELPDAFRERYQALGAVPAFARRSVRASAVSRF